MNVFSLFINSTFGILLFIQSGLVLATSDAETPEQELEILRLILLEKEVLNVLAKMKEAGCRWHSEFIWFYAPEKKAENIYRWSGELVVQFEEEYSAEKSVRFSFRGVYTETGRTVDSVTFESSDPVVENCV